MQLKWRLEAYFFNDYCEISRIERLDLVDFTPEVFGEFRQMLHAKYSSIHNVLLITLEKHFFQPEDDHIPYRRISLLSFTSKNDFFALEADELFFNYRYIG